MSVYEADLITIRNDTEEECLPLPTFSDIANNPLTAPVDKFIMLIQELFRPIKVCTYTLMSKIVIYNPNHMCDNIQIKHCTYCLELNYMVAYLCFQSVVSGSRKLLLLDIDDRENGAAKNTSDIWRENDLQYIGMILMVPRAICLLILIFGCLVSNYFVCQMQIIECIEPRKYVLVTQSISIY